MLLDLVEVAQGDEPGELSFAVDERQLLELGATEDLEGHFARRALGRGRERSGRHDVADERGLVVFALDEAHVAVGDDADEHAVVVGHGQPRDAVLAADAVDVGHSRVWACRDRVGDHARLGALDAVDHVRLVFDREVAVEDAETTGTGHGDCHAVLGDGVHGAGDDGNLQADVASQLRCRVCL